WNAARSHSPSARPSTCNSSWPLQAARFPSVLLSASSPRLFGGLNCIKIRLMLVLGIETSCDETGVALYDGAEGRLLAHVVHSQVAMHEAYGGVVPELASRDHIRRLVPLTRLVLERSGHGMAELSRVGY